MDLNVRRDTRCEEYCKWSNTNGWNEMVVVLLSQEYCTAGKSSQLIRFENQKELLYKYILNFIILLLIVVVVGVKVDFHIIGIK